MKNWKIGIVVCLLSIAIFTFGYITSIATQEDCVQLEPSSYCGQIDNICSKEIDYLCKLKAEEICPIQKECLCPACLEEVPIKFEPVCNKPSYYACHPSGTLNVNISSINIKCLDGSKRIWDCITSDWR